MALFLGPALRAAYFMGRLSMREEMLARDAETAGELRAVRLDVARAAGR